MAALVALICLTSVLTFVTTVNHCNFNGKTYGVNEQFHPEGRPCDLCICSKYTTVACTSVYCPAITCVDSVQVQGQCCWTCPNGQNCLHGNHLLRNGELYRLPNGDICQCPLVDPSKSHGNYTQAICGKP